MVPSMSFFFWVEVRNQNSTYRKGEIAYLLPWTTFKHVWNILQHPSCSDLGSDWSNDETSAMKEKKKKEFRLTCGVLPLRCKNVHLACMRINSSSQLPLNWRCRRMLKNSGTPNLNAVRNMSMESKKKKQQNYLNWEAMCHVLPSIHLEHRWQLMI